MIEKTIELNGKSYTVKEMKYIDAIELDTNDKKASAIKLIKSCVSLSDEEINNLTVREGIELNKIIDEINGLQDFRQASEKK